MEVIFNFMHNDIIAFSTAITFDTTETTPTIKQAFNSAILSNNFPYPSLLDYTKIGDDGFTFEDTSGNSLDPDVSIIENAQYRAIIGKSNYKYANIKCYIYDNVLECLDFNRDDKTVSLKENYASNISGETYIEKTLGDSIDTTTIISGKSYMPLIGRYIKTINGIETSEFFVDKVDIFSGKDSVEFLNNILSGDENSSLIIEYFYATKENNILVFQNYTIKNVLNNSDGSNDTIFNSTTIVAEWGPDDDGSEAVSEYTYAPVSTWESYKDNVVSTDGNCDVILTDLSINGTYNKEWYVKKDGVSYPYPANTISVTARAQPKTVNVNIFMYADDKLVEDTNTGGIDVKWSDNGQLITNPSTVTINSNSEASVLINNYSYKTSKITQKITAKENEQDKIRTSTYLYNKLTTYNNNNVIEISDNTVFDFQTLIEYEFAFRAIFVITGVISLNVKAKLFAWRETIKNGDKPTVSFGEGNDWPIITYYKNDLDKLIDTSSTDWNNKLPSNFRQYYNTKLDTGHYKGSTTTYNHYFGIQTEAVANVATIDNITLGTDDGSDPTLGDWLKKRYENIDITEPAFIEKFAYYLNYSEYFNIGEDGLSLYGRLIDIDGYENTKISEFIDGSETNTNITVYIDIIEPIQINTRWKVFLPSGNDYIWYDNKYKILHYNENNDTYKDFLMNDNEFNSYINKNNYSINSIKLNNEVITTTNISYDFWIKDKFYYQKRDLTVYLNNKPEQTSWVVGNGIIYTNANNDLFRKYIFDNIKNTYPGQSYSNDKRLINETIFRDSRISGSKMYLLSDLDQNSVSDSSNIYSEESSTIYNNSFYIEDGDAEELTTPLFYQSAPLKYGIRATDLFMASNNKEQIKILSTEGYQLFTMHNLISSRSLDTNDKYVKRFVIALTAGGGGGGHRRWWMGQGNKGGGGGGSAATIVLYIDMSSIMTTKSYKWFIVSKDGHRGGQHEDGHTAQLFIFATTEDYPTSVSDATISEYSSDLVCTITCPGGYKGSTQEWIWSKAEPSWRSKEPTYESSSKISVYPLIKFTGLSGNGGYDDSQVKVSTYVKVNSSNDLSLEDDGTMLTTFLGVDGKAFGNLNSKGIDFRRNNSAINPNQISFIYKLYESCIFKDTKVTPDKYEGGQSIWSDSYGAGGKGEDADGWHYESGKDGAFIIFY